MKRIFGLWALCALIATAAMPALAHDCGGSEVWEEETLPSSSFRVDYYNPTHDVYVRGGWRHVRRVHITAHSIWSNGGNLEVIVNGCVKRTLFVSNYSHDYTVDVGETINSITFHYTSGDYIDVTDVRADVSHRVVDQWCHEDHYSPQPAPDFHSSLPERNIATWLANRTIHNVDQLIPYADPATEYVPYLLPVKTVAGRAHATAAAEGDLSSNTKASLKALSAQIVFAEPVITALMKKPVSFDMAVELLSIKHEIDDRLH